MSSFLVLCEGETRNRWRDEQVGPDVRQGTIAPWARRFGCVLAREVKRDFGDLPIRRDEGRVVNTPLVFKRVLFQGRREFEKRTKRRSEENEKSRGDNVRRERRRDERRKAGRRRERERRLKKDQKKNPGLEWKEDERRWR
ncbi:hypothetical protein TNCV_3134031 [Trichonephila clavipes]|nr:hypothetical protein TNCV_3134031 [Trichonephila clavipes]